MGFDYRPTAEESAAAALLRERGWRVDQPACPECHGFGRVTWFEFAQPGVSVAYSMKPCPRGCPMPQMFYGLSAAIHGAVTADGIQGMRRGVG